MIHLAAARSREPALVARCGQVIDGIEHRQTNLFALINCPRCSDVFRNETGRAGGSILKRNREGKKR